MQDQDIENFFARTGRFANATLIAFLYFVGFMIWDVSKSKALFACLIVILMQIKALGAGRIRQIEIVFVLLSVFYWIDILPLHKLSLVAFAKIEEAISVIQSNHAMARE
jgi:hypothetical protein